MSISNFTSLNESIRPPTSPPPVGRPYDDYEVHDRNPISEEATQQQCKQHPSAKGSMTRLLHSCRTGKWKKLKFKKSIHFGIEMSTTTLTTITTGSGTNSLSRYDVRVTIYFEYCLLTIVGVALGQISNADKTN